MLHRCTGFVSNDPFTPGHISKLGRIADRVAHIRDPAFVDEVHDQLHFVQALKIRHLRRISGIDQGLKTGPHEFGHSAAQNGLFPKQIGLGLFFERGLQDRRASPADGRRVGHGHRLGIPGRVLRNRDQAGHTPALLKFTPDEMAGTFGGDHENVHRFGRNNFLEVDIKSVRTSKVFPGGEPGFNIRRIHLAGDLVGRQDHDDIGVSRGSSDLLDHKAGLLGLFPGAAVFPQPNPDIHPGVTQVESVGVALTAVSDNDNFLTRKQGQIGIVVIINIHAHATYSLCLFLLSSLVSSAGMTESLWMLLAQPTHLSLLLQCIVHGRC